MKKIAFEFLTTMFTYLFILNVFYMHANKAF